MLRKLATIILGLVLIVGAAGFFAQRYGYISIRQLDGLSSGRLFSRNLDRAPTRTVRGLRSEKPKRKKLAVFDRVLDLLNLVVGVAGIWFSVVGLRMQRAATAMMALRDEDRSGD